MISTYLIIRFSNSKFDEHPPRYAFVHGITVAASFCFRATNCIAICGAVFIITILLIKKQRYKNLIFNIIAFSFGFMIVFCPFLIYFALNKAVPDFMWGTFLYNFMYASEKVHHNSAEWQMICLYFVTCNWKRVFGNLGTEKIPKCNCILFNINDNNSSFVAIFFPHYTLLHFTICSVS